MGKKVNKAVIPVAELVQNVAGDQGDSKGASMIDQSSST